MKGGNIDMMISIWHLLWIVPVCTFLGFFIAALMVAAHDDRDDYIESTPKKV